MEAWRDEEMEGLGGGGGFFPKGMSGWKWDWMVIRLKRIICRTNLRWLMALALADGFGFGFGSLGGGGGDKI